MFKRGICEVKSLDNPDWHCKIDEGLGGMSYARWAPDSRRILTVSNFNVRMTIWSLIDRSTSYISMPKYADKGLSFTSNGAFMALTERRETKDHIGIYYTGDWSLVAHFPVDSYDLQDIIWSKDNTAIVVYDSILECKFFIYSPTGNLITFHQPYTLNLGIKSLKFSPNGHYLSVGFYDQTVRLYNHITWKIIIDLVHPSTIDLNSGKNLNIFREEEVEEISYSGDSKKTTKYVEVKAPVKFNCVKPNLEKPYPMIGVSEMSWSFDSNFLATKNDNMPNTLFVWQISSLSLHTVILQRENIKNFSWSPTDHILLICTENSKLYSFTLNNVYVVELVTDANLSLNINRINWNSNGKYFTVSDNKNLVIGQPEINEGEVDQNITINESRMLEEQGEEKIFHNDSNNLQNYSRGPISQNSNDQTGQNYNNHNYENSENQEHEHEHYDENYNYEENDYRNYSNPNY